MKRVLSLVLALVLVLGMIPTFAADATGAQNLYDNGFITGKDGATVDAKLDVNAELTRAELAALIAELNGAKEEAAAFAQPADFTDADMFQDWAKPFIAYAQENTWMNGYPDGSFGADKAVPANQLAAVLLNALGYDFDFATVLETAADLGIVVEGDKLTRGEAFEAMWTAVSAVNVNGEEMTLGVKLGKLEPEVPVVTDLMVSDVVADNLKAITVMFNQEIDKDTVTATTVKGMNGTTNVVASRTLLDDNKTLVLELNTLTQSTTVTITVDGVKTPAGDAVVAFTQAYVVNDVTVPNLLSAVPLNAKQIELTFSEPVQMSQTLFTLWADVKVDGNAIVAKATPDNAKNTILLTFSTAIAEGTHSIEVKGIKDYANITAPTKTLDFTVVKDDKAPVATSVTVKSKTSVVVKFDEPVNTTGSFKVDSVDRTGTTTFNALGTEATITGLNLGVAAIVEVKVEYKGQKDIMGNEVTDWTTIITKVTDDTTLPTVELTSVGAGNKLTFTFSKSMATTGKLQILDSKSVVKEEITIAAFKSNSDSKILEVTPSTLVNANPADFTAKFVDMKDVTIRENALPTTSIAFKSLDTKAPTVEAKYLATAGKDSDGTANSDKDTITLFFSEAMDVATLENLANYFVGGQPMTTLSAAVSAKAATDGKSVAITYKNAVALAPSVTVYSVKDLAGNILTPASGTVATKQTATALNYASAKAVDRNTIEVTFDTPIKSVDPSLLVVHDGTQVVTNFVSATVKSTDSKVVVFKTATAINTATAIYELRVATPTAIQNVYNTGLTTGGVAYATNAVMTAAGFVVDYVAPELVSIKPYTVAEVVQNNKFVIKFSEVVTAGTLANVKNDLIIKYANGNVVADGAYTISDIQTTPSTDILVTLAPNASLANGSNSISVQLFTDRYIIDNTAQNNTALTFAATTVTVTADAVAPTVSAGLSAAAASITVTDASAITFSETLTAGAKTNVENAITAALTAGVGGADSIAYVWSSNDTVVTLDVTDGAADGVFLTIPAGDVKADLVDLVGNTTTGAVLVNDTTN